jgi:hypothetical protein
VLVCMFVNSSRREEQVCFELSVITSRDQKEKMGGSELRKKCVLISIPGEGISCSSEIKHVRRMTSRPRFVSKTLLQKQKVTTPFAKSDLRSIPGEDIFCSSETKHGRTAA